VLVATGALAEIESRIERLTADATAAIKASPLSDDAKEHLVELAHYVAWREK
jgi:geranylgeranyl pyrophosphate synthase